MAALGEMSYEIGHELKNYLQAISLSSEILPDLIQTNNYKKAQGYSQMILENMNRMTTLTNGLMDFSSHKVQKEMSDICQLIDATIRFVEPQNLFEGIHFKRTYLTQGLKISVDSGQFQQVLLNLFRNAGQAIQNTRKDGGTIEIIVKTSPKDKNMLLISVKDNGPGIPKNMLNRIFEPKFTSKESGHGLGLSICYRIIDNHKGWIKAESKTGRGTVFHMGLPLTSS
jgi:two-component system NtrC family sensor kinase